MSKNPELEKMIREYEESHNPKTADVLYHGTDARIVRMDDSQRQDYFDSCMIAGNYLYQVWKPYESDYDDSRSKPIFTSRGPIFRETLLDGKRDVNLMMAIAYTGLRLNNCDLWQYGDVYATTMKEHAIGFARNAWAGGELGRFTYYMYDGICKFQIKEWDPTKEVKESLKKVIDFAEADPQPVLFTFKDVPKDFLLNQNGKPLGAGWYDKNVGENFRFKKDKVKLNINDAEFLHFDGFPTRPIK